SPVVEQIRECRRGDLDAAQVGAVAAREYRRKMFDLLRVAGLAVADEHDLAAEALDIIAGVRGEDLIVTNARQRSGRAIEVEKPRAATGIERAQRADCHRS